MKFVTVAISAILGITGSEAIFNGHLAIGPETSDENFSFITNLILTDKDTGSEYSCQVFGELAKCHPDTFCTCDFVQSEPPQGEAPDTFGVEVVLNNRCLTLDFVGNKDTNKLQCCITFPCDLAPVA